MYKVMIVEDEMLVRVGLKNLIDWKSFNMEVIADEANGQAAWDTFKKARPEIVITDIVIPFMDGIQLISEIRKIDDHKTKVIILTCMEDFKTVHAALSMGVSDYIVKLTMTEEEMEEKLRRLKNELDVINETSRHVENKSPLKEDFLKNQIRYNLYSQENFTNHLHELNLFMDHSKLYLCTIEIDQLKGALNKYGHHLKDAVLNVLNETLVDCRSSTLFADDEHRFVLLVSFQDLLSESQMNEQLMLILNRLQMNILIYLKLHVSVGVSQYYDVGSNLKKMYEESMSALQARFFTEIGKIHYYNRDTEFVKSARENAKVTIIKLSEKYEKLLGKDHISEIRDAFIGIDYQTNQYNIKVKSLALQWLMIPSALYNVMGQPFFAIQDAYSSVIQECETFEEIIAAHESYIKELTEQSKMNLSREIVKAKEFIHLHFVNEMSLEQVAKHVGLSSSYLSYLFKKELGINFIDYLVGLRIEKVKELLSTTNLKFYEIAVKVGFNDNTYLSRAFKKITGVNPNEYRKKNKWS